VADDAATAVGVLVEVELAEQDRAGGVESASDLGVLSRDAVGEQRARAGRADAGGVDQVLEADRHAVQRAAIVAARELVLGGARLGEREVGGDGDERVERGVEACDALEALRGDVHGREPLRAVRGAERGDREGAEVSGHRAASSASRKARKAARAAAGFLESRPSAAAKRWSSKRAGQSG
jgi:hypothetical protein